MKRSLVILWLLLCHSLHAETTYKIGVEDIPYMPFYETVDGKFQGYALEILNAFAKDNDIKFEYIPLPVKRLFMEYLDENKELDFKFPDNAYWAQDLKKGKQLSYSVGLVAFTDGVMVVPESEKITKDQLKRLGIVRGFTPWEFLDDISSNKIEKVESNSLDSLLKLVLLKRVNGAYVNVDVANYFLKNNLKQPGALVLNNVLDHTISAYSISSYKHPEVLKKLDKWIKDNKTKHEEILKKWGLKK